jgi:hypothetical protein
VIDFWIVFARECTYMHILFIYYLATDRFNRYLSRAVPPIKHPHIHAGENGWCRLPARCFHLSYSGLSRGAYEGFVLEIYPLDIPRRVMTGLYIIYAVASAYLLFYCRYGTIYDLMSIVMTCVHIPRLTHTQHTNTHTSRCIYFSICVHTILCTPTHISPPTFTRMHCRYCAVFTFIFPRFSTSGRYWMSIRPFL